ncbi:MAG: tRNA (adenosine(37)-N6)-threonylcarbamoyltransferase complex dimerization subunit type 1 TsaB [Clostridia bacterium]|nr:tRNA (adenosine(37)-N6)-threonylcarbamoyltransferase complex dimerization subunit type 1 TsaB [Clostridia bacterium]
MKILAIDSSAAAASAALAEDGKLLGEFFLNVGLTHSCTLQPMVESLLRYAGVPIRDVDLFAVTNGPGSFTGVRIGVSAVKGMAQPLGKPCVGVSTLEAMAFNVRDTDSLICCTMDARRSQVYTALFEQRAGRIVRLTPDDAVSLAELGERLRQAGRQTVLVGDGAELCFDAFRDSVPGVRTAPQTIRHQRAASVAAAVWENIDVLPLRSAEELSASYLRLSQAERERKEKMEAEYK